MEATINLAREVIQKLRPYSSARMESAEKGIQLDANENPFERDDALNRYPSPQPLLLRQALAKMYEVRPSQLLMTRGSDEGIDLLIRVFCEPHKDSILITPPTYGMYEVAANIQGVAVKEVPLNQDFSLNKDKILEFSHSNVKLIFLCSPSNPTGNLLDKNAVLTLCKALQSKAVLVLDEAYIEFATDKSLVSYIAKCPNLVVLRTLSKAFGLAGARLGSLIASENIISLLLKVIAPYPIPLPVEAVALRSLTAKNQAKVRAQIQIIRTEREKLCLFLKSLDSVVCVYPSEANFLLVKVKDATKWMELCRSERIIIRSRTSLFGLENCVRITIGTIEENARLREVLSNV